MTTSLFVDSAVVSAIWIAIKATALLGLAVLVQAAIHRRASAATRHFVWMLAIVALLALPFAGLVVPEWQVPVRSVAGPSALSVPSSDRIPDRDVATAERSSLATVGGSEQPAPLTPQAPEFPWWTMIAGLYSAGVIVVLTYLTLQHWAITGIAKRATALSAAEWMALLSDCARDIGVRRTVRLLRNRESMMPLACGTVRPSILMPAIADLWPDDRRRAVMLHELAHVARYDCLTQMLACAVCAIYWFHPAAWWVARRLRIERELACDDRVIQAGTAARDYAGHLLEIAYSPSGHRAPALAVGMARSRHLEGRMLAALDAAKNRAVPGPRARIVAVTVVAVVLVVIAGVRPTIVASAGYVSPGGATDAVVPAQAQEATIAPHLKVIEWPPVLLRMFDAVTTMLGFAQDAVGAWELRPTATKGIVHLRLSEGRSTSGSNISIDKLEGLTAAQLEGSGGLMTFRMRRDAGTFVFEGVLNSGIGAGTFSFQPNPEFPAQLVGRGFTRPTAREQYEMARHDVGFALIDELSRHGYQRPLTSQLVKAGQHGVRETYVREMAAIGQRLGTVEALITLRDHGVTPEYIRALQELGYKDLSADAARNARDHGVTPEFVRELADAGHRNLSLDQIINVRDHGVNPEYAREMRQLGHTLPIADLINARDHGITIDFIREMASLGYRSLPMDSLVRLRDHGVTAEYVRAIKALGYDPIAADDLIMLRDHGLTADRIRAANARAGTRLPVDMLKALGR